MGYFSNGSEGSMYESKYCENCIHWVAPEGEESEGVKINWKQKEIDTILFTIGLLDDETEKVVLKLIDRFESKIRQDQKEQCANVVSALCHDCETPNGDDALERENIINAIMESSQ